MNTDILLAPDGTALLKDEIPLLPQEVQILDAAFKLLDRMKVQYALRCVECLERGLHPHATGNKDHGRLIVECGHARRIGQLPMVF